MKNFVVSISSPFLPIVLFMSIFSASYCAADDWKQREVTDLASQIISSLKGIVEAAGDGSSQPEAIQEKNYNAALVDLKVLIAETQKLEKMLIDGLGMQRTIFAFRQITNLRKSVGYYADNTLINDEIRSKAAAVRALFETLDSYYK